MSSLITNNEVSSKPLQDADDSRAQRIVFKDNSVFNIKHWRKIFLQTIVLSSLLTSIAIPAIGYATTGNDGIRVYQNTPGLSDENKQNGLSEEHKQNITDDISRFKQADNLWDVLRDEFSLPHYENNPVVQERIEWFMNNQDFLLRSVNRASPYLHYILQQVKKRHLPAELVLLPIVESGYNPFATSPVGAAGIWQLMPGTATGLGVQQDWWYDGRRDVIASTRAALNYLAYLQSFFDGNWLLAIAAYNTGEGNVLAAIRRNINDGRDTDFWSLPVAQETKNYVPSILALAIIISKPNQYPIYFPPVRNAPYLAQFDVRSKINLKVAAALAGISYNKMLQLNPGFNRAAAKGPYKLVLPIENVEQFSENLVRSPYHETSAPTWKHYRMKAGDTLATVSRKFKIPVDEIRRFNHLAKSNPRRGTNILIPDDSSKITALASAPAISAITFDDPPSKRKTKKMGESIASRVSSKLIQAENRSKTYNLQPGDTIYMVRSSDTLEKIAHRFQISPAALKTANRLKGPVSPGKHLVIPTHRVASNLARIEVKVANKPTVSNTVYQVRRGDTIAKIAKRFHTSAASIRLANLIDDSSLLEGVNLVIPSPVRS